MFMLSSLHTLDKVCTGGRVEFGDISKGMYVGGCVPF